MRPTSFVLFHLFSPKARKKYYQQDFLRAAKGAMKRVEERAQDVVRCGVKRFLALVKNKTETGVRKEKDTTGPPVPRVSVTALGFPTAPDRVRLFNVEERMYPVAGRPAEEASWTIQKDAAVDSETEIEIQAARSNDNDDDKQEDGRDHTHPLHLRHKKSTSSTRTTFWRKIDASQGNTFWVSMGRNS